MALIRSFRLEMLQVARLAPKVLGESAELVEAYVEKQITKEGGFADRQNRADLYYTVFGIENLLALRAEIPREKIAPYIESFGDGERLDFVHLCSLARCAAGLGGGLIGHEQRRHLAQRIEGYRTPEGGYHGTRGKPHGSAYGALLAWGAYSDLDLPMPNEAALGASVQGLRLPDGSFANEDGMIQGTTTATAAAVTLCRHLGLPVAPETGHWLLQQVHPSGGFLATPGAPLPDLLSTATALHALDSLGVPYDHLRDLCLDFVDSLWSAEGGFHGHWADDELDVEYTSYGLLALGHLS